MKRRVFIALLVGAFTQRGDHRADPT